MVTRSLVCKEGTDMSFKKVLVMACHHSSIHCNPLKRHPLHLCTYEFYTKVFDLLRDEIF